MWFLVLQTGDNCQFTSPWDKTANCDKDRNDSCTTNVCPAVIPMLEYLVGCMTTMLSQNIFQWMWFLRLETGDKELPLCITLELNQNLWQGQEWQLLNGSSSCRLTNTCVSCQMHDNDSIIGYFTVNVIPCASNWGQPTVNLLYHGTKLPIVTRTGMTTAQPMFVLQLYKCLSLLSDA